MLIADAVERHGGRVFERVGDAAYTAFSEPSEAILASTELARLLADADWGEVGHLRVRVSLDCGHAERREDRFFGAPLFRAARVRRRRIPRTSPSPTRESPGTR
jgi:class 3 adenylate cyclase